MSRRFELLLTNGTPFAEGVLFSNGKVALSFLKEEYQFIYKSMMEMLSMHSNGGDNMLKFIDE